MFMMLNDSDDVTQGFFVTVRAGTAYREMKMTNVYAIFCMSVLYYCNKLIMAYRHFSRETLRMYKISANIAKFGWREIVFVVND